MKLPLKLFIASLPVAFAGHHNLRNQRPREDDKCIGAASCQNVQNIDNIGEGSCWGSKSCMNAVTAIVGEGSCWGSQSCMNTETAIVGEGSCLGSGACYGFMGEYVGDGSCINLINKKYPDGYDHGGGVCFGIEGNVGDGSCLGFGACRGAGDGDIGNNSCINDQTTSEKCDKDNPKKLCYACARLGGNVGDNSCKRGAYACYDITANVGENSCIGPRACQSAGWPYKSEQGDEIGNDSCQGDHACAYKPFLPMSLYRHAVHIGDDACNGMKACCGRRDPVDDGECNKAYECCCDYDCPGGCNGRILPGCDGPEQH